MKKRAGKAVSKVRWSNNENSVDFPDELATGLVIGNQYIAKSACQVIPKKYWTEN